MSGNPFPSDFGLPGEGDARVGAALTTLQRLTRQQTGFALKRADYLNAPVTLTTSPQTIQTLTFNVTSPDSILLLVSSYHFRVTVTGVILCVGQVENAGALGVPVAEAVMQEDARGLTVSAQALVTGLAAGTHSFISEVFKGNAGGTAVAQDTLGTSFVGLLIDR